MHPGAEAGFDDPVRHPPEVSPGDEVTRGSGDGRGSDRGFPHLESHRQPMVAVEGEEPILVSIDKRYISEAIGQQVDSLRTCSEKELQQDPTLAGTVVLSFTITADGSVSAASVRESTVNNAAVERCV